ncbi:MAG TPA: hypothetical protein VK390_12845 [Propionibacteriaceae bacterium]|nr:hypothetical protein [Propionibacteriaceae bacterium]
MDGLRSRHRDGEALGWALNKQIARKAGICDLANEENPGRVLELRGLGDGTAHLRFRDQLPEELVQQILKAVRPSAGSFSNLKPDCSPGPLPEIKVVTPANTGVIAVRRRQGKLCPATRCPNADATAQIVSYQAKPTPDQDEVVFQVTLPNGKVVLHTVVISVTEGPGTGRSNDDDQP